MSREEVVIGIRLDLSTANNDIEELQRKNDEVTAAAVKARREVERTVRAAGSMLRSLMSVGKAYLQLFGVSIGAMGNALTAIIENIIAVAIAYVALETAVTAGTVGINTAILALAVASLEISIIQAIAVAQGNERAQQQLQNLDAAIGATSGFISSLDGL